MPQEPIDVINAPTTKIITRYSLFFTNGTAQDVNVELTDKVTETAKLFTFERSGGVKETVYKAHLAFTRVRKLEVPLRRPKLTEGDTE